MLGIEISDAEFESLWAEMDKDGGGTIGFREFKDAMKQLRTRKL